MKRINTSTFESGQALVEYILLLMIVLLISVGLLYQFNRSVRSYVNVFFGEYVACLIASGQLPSLGSEDSTGCEKPSFSFSSTDESFSSADNSNAYDGSNNNTGSNVVNNNRGRSLGSTSLSGAAGGGSRGISSNGSESGRIPISDSSDSAGDNSGGLGSSYGRESRVLVSDSSQAASDSRSSSGRMRNVPVSSLDVEKDQDTLQANQMVSPDQIGKVRLVPISETGGNRIDASQTDTGLDLSGFIKWLFIIGILIAILVLLFMQAVQIKKGLEK